MKIANGTLPLLVRKEKKLLKKFSGKIENKANIVLQTNSDMKVY